MRSAIILIASVAVLMVLNVLVWQKEQTVSSGRTILLQLVPRDPRSLMQGDYMVLRYALADQAKSVDLAEKGRLVLKLDPSNIGSYARFDDGTPLAAGECLLIYRRRGDLRLGAESFLFQEGDADLYNAARFGELKVDVKGNSILVGLRDEKLQPLGKAVVK